jgi:DNA-binding HxlR family transcriptional regulator
MKAQLQPFRVEYSWTEAGQVRRAHTVWNGENQADAERRFQRRTPWVKVVPINPVAP